MFLPIMRKDFDEWMMPVCAPAPFIPVRGEGSRLWNQQGKEYIDSTGGIAVNALGHTHSVLREALDGQASKFRHTGNGYTNESVLRLARKLVDVTFAERILFCNSGAEINEAALGLARKHTRDRLGNQKSGIVAFKNAFYGRTLLIVNAGGQPTYSQDFAPLPPDIRHAIYNDLDSASQPTDDTTCAVIMEPVQDGGDVIPATETFLQGLCGLCGRRNAPPVFDEVQTDADCTGELYVYMYYGVTPNLLTTARALGGDFPIGALLAAERCVSVMTVDTRGTAYGGNPLAVAVAGKLLEIVNTPEVLNKVKQCHDQFVEHINVIDERFGLSSEIRGLGLLIGCVLNAGLVGEVKLASQEAVIAGVTALITDANVVCFAPALNVNEEKVAIGLDRFALACEHIRAGGSS